MSRTTGNGKRKSDGSRTRRNLAAGKTVKKDTAALRKIRKETAERKNFLKKEAGFVFAAFCALFLLGSDFGFFGTIGSFFERIQKGLFGYCAFLFPGLLVFTVYIFLRERRNFFFWLKLASGLILLICLSSMIHLLFSADSTCSFSQYYEMAGSSETLKYAAGGALGGFTGSRIRSTLAMAGTWLLLLTLSVLCTVMITERSIIQAVRKGAERASRTAIQGSNYAREKIGEERIRMEARREAAQLRRREEAMEADLRSREVSVPGPSSSVFDLKAGNRDLSAAGNAEGNRNPVPSGIDFLKNAEEATVSLGNEEISERSAEPDYGSDAVPFLESTEERYRSYGKMLSGDKIDLKAAERMGFAVSRTSSQLPEPAGSLQGESPDTDPFHCPDIAASAAEAEHSASEDFIDSDYREKEDHLHRPLDPAEIIYPEPPAEEVKESTLRDGYDELFHITDEDRNYVYDEREKAAGSDELYEPFGNERFPAEDQSEKTEAKQEKKEQPAAETAQKPRQQLRRKPYQFPPVSLLKKGSGSGSRGTDQTVENARKLEQVLAEFGVGVRVTNVVKGPRVTRYEMAPDVGVKVSRITSLAGDIKLALAASELRIEAPIPGKSAVGIEVPNNESVTVTFRDIMETESFRQARSRLAWGVGLDIQGSPVVGDISKMPHLLVSGTTGSGKSVGINSIIMSVIYRAKPEEVKMILVDPKVVELSVYDGIPHLLAPVVTRPDKALAVLNKACAEMQHRYNLFKESNTRNIVGYNEKVEEVCRSLPEDAEKPEKLPYILIIIDELSELMMHAKKDVESAIVSLTQLARAAGIHLVVATQRPSVDVVTGLIKSNIPSRVAYRLPSGTDSRTILDSIGAETLLGNGDMLYKPGNVNSPLRVQGAYLSDSEVEEVVEWLRKHNSCFYEEEWENVKAASQAGQENSGITEGESGDGRDEYFMEAGILITEKKKASIGLLQRKFKIGFNRASRIMEQLNEAGVVSEGEGTKERQILMSPEEFRERF